MRLVFLLILLGALTGISSVDGQTYEGSVRVETSRMEVLTDSLYLDFDISIRSEVVSTGDRVLIIPRLKGKTDSLRLPYIELSGRDKARMARRSRKLHPGESGEALAAYARLTVHPATDTLIRYRMQLPGAPWMEGARFEFLQEWENAAGERRVSLYAVVCDIGGQGPAVPYWVTPHPAFLLPGADDLRQDIDTETAKQVPVDVSARTEAQARPQEKTPKRYIRGEAFFDFPNGSSVFNSSYSRNRGELEKLSRAVRSVTDSLGGKITGIALKGCASIEGSYTLNDRLSHERTLAVRDWMRQNMGIRLPQEAIRAEWVAEDWDRLEQLLEARPHFPSRDAMLHIIRGVDIFQGREKLLMELAGGAPYRQMAKELFPLLRRVEFQIDYEVDADSKQARARTQAVKETPEAENPKIPTVRELLLVAQCYGEGTSRFGEMIKAAYRLHPSNPDANLNMAALLLQEGDTINVQEMLDRSPRCAAWDNNLGLLRLLRGELPESEKLLRRSAGKGCKPAEANLGELDRLRRSQGMGN